MDDPTCSVPVDHGGFGGRPRKSQIIRNVEVAHSGSVVPTNEGQDVCACRDRYRVGTRVRIGGNNCFTQRTVRIAPTIVRVGGFRDSESERIERSDAQPRRDERQHDVSASQTHAHLVRPLLQSSR